MNTVKDALAQKSGALIHVRSGDMVVEALRQMRDNRVRSVLVIDDDVLVGIVTQGDCAIKVLLPGLDAKQTPVGQVMTGDPVTVKPYDQLEGCMAMMAARGFRHLPVLAAGKAQPATAPAGSNRSSYGGDEIAEAFGKRVTNW